MLDTKIGPVVLEKKILKHDAQRRTPTGNNKSSEHSGYLKT